MALFMNQTGFVAGVITNITNNITGSIFLTLLLIMVLLILVALLFRFPIEMTVILLAPMFIVSMAATSDFLGVGGVVLIYLGIIIAKNFFLK